jgi:hypothetical protein
LCYAKSAKQNMEEIRDEMWVEKIWKMEKMFLIIEDDDEDMR